MLSNYKKIDNYILENQIGEGQFGKVYKSLDLVTNQYVAIKVVQKQQLERDQQLKMFLRCEINIMKQIQNRNVVMFIKQLESVSNYYIVMEYCDQGDLESQIKKSKYIYEQQAVNYLLQLLNGFKGLHEKGIMHRDFKPANVFIKNGQLKIGDLGFASQQKVLHQQVGTPYYMAPEILKQFEYTNKADIWALGVTYYQMLFGCYPFEAPDIQNLLIKATANNINFSVNGLQISNESIDLIKKMLNPCQFSRIEWSDIYAHPLFLKFDLKKKQIQAQDLHQIKFQDQNIQDNIQFYQDKENLINIDKNLDNLISKLMKNEQDLSFIQKEEIECQEKLFQEFKQKQLQNQHNQQEIHLIEDHILGVRNQYLHIALTLEQAFLFSMHSKDCILNFFFIKKILQLSSKLYQDLNEKKKFSQFSQMDNFYQSENYKVILQLICDELELYKIQFEGQMQDALNISQKFKENKAEGFNENIIEYINSNLNKEFNHVYEDQVFDYLFRVKEIVDNPSKNLKKENDQDKILDLQKQYAIHCIQILECISLQKIDQSVTYQLNNMQDHKNKTLEQLLQLIDQQFTLIF